MDYELDRGIAVTPAGPGAHDVVLDPGWVVGGGVNGGDALTDLGTPDPISLSAYFLRPTRPGPVRVQVRRLRTGGRRSTGSVSLVQEQDGSPVERITALATYGDLGALPSDVQRQIPPPDLPPVEDCLEARFDSH